MLLGELPERSRRGEPQQWSAVSAEPHSGDPVRAYGMQEAGALSDKQKSQNADNWEYFYEKIFCNGL